MNKIITIKHECTKCKKTYTIKILIGTCYTNLNWNTESRGYLTQNNTHIKSICPYKNCKYQDEFAIDFTI